MKLELKHIAPYLPYGLKFKSNTSELIWSPQPSNFANDWKFEFVNSKPILRPLSDLTEQYLLNNGLDYLGRWQIIIGYKQKHFPECIYYNEVQFLLENHFDVFGLIDQGLAIDKNTLNDSL